MERLQTLDRPLDRPYDRSLDHYDRPSLTEFKVHTTSELSPMRSLHAWCYVVWQSLPRPRNFLLIFAGLLVFF